MTSYEFEVAAKNAVIEVVKEDLHEDYTINDISLVWFSHILGRKKAILIDNGKNDRIYEVTYDYSKEQMYVDIYSKMLNHVILKESIDTKADVNNNILARKLLSIADSGVLSSESTSCLNKAADILSGNAADKVPVYPCVNCCSPSERASCCGCQKEKQWQEKYGNKKS